MNTRIAGVSVCFTALLSACDAAPESTSRSAGSQFAGAPIEQDSSPAMPEEASTVPVEEKSGEEAVSDPEANAGEPSESYLQNAIDEKKAYSDTYRKALDLGGDRTEMYTQLAKLFAPRVIMHSEELYLPSSVEFFLANVDVGKEFMVAKEKLDCPSCVNPKFLRGQSIADGQVPIYAQIVKRGHDPDTTDIIYWTFYPYNRGKRVCLGLYFGSKLGCLGPYSTFGHHVGDWEHLTIRFKNAVPQAVAMSQHSGSEVLNFNDSRLKLVDDTHPVVYAALGSHGLYAAAKSTQYKKLPNGDALVDVTANGKSWDSWHNVISFERDDTSAYSGDLGWLNYHQRWGNPKDGCAVSEQVAGECILNPGPTGPLLKSFAQPGFTGFE